jgi:hypothetical protein
MRGIKDSILGGLPHECSREQQADQGHKGGVDLHFADLIKWQAQKGEELSCLLQKMDLWGGY